MKFLSENVRGSSGVIYYPVRPETDMGICFFAHNFGPDKNNLFFENPF